MDEIKRFIEVLNREISLIYDTVRFEGVRVLAMDCAYIDELIFIFEAAINHDNAEISISPTENI